jgi:glycosyltransferase involved in cell wall biosynthesis
MSTPSFFERLQQTRRLLQTEGRSGVSDRVRRRLADRIAPQNPAGSRVSRDDLVRAAEVARSGWTLPEPLTAAQGEPLTVAWVTVPPGAGSGGHTTMFRLASALEAAGHRCILYLIDDHGWTLDQHRRPIRSWWRWLNAEVRDAADGIEDAHAIFATSWDTAYRVLGSPARGKRFYLVQDFEPWFYPAGSDALLAEATYRFGFHGVTAGRWLAEHLRREYNMTAEHFDFGRDPLYSLDPDFPPERRTGVCMFSRPETPRRATELAVMALDLFAARHPEIDIHLFGEPLAGLPFAATDHGTRTPQQLSELYHQCIAGLVLSATNVSLVPHEMLAAGCIPVVNDAEHNRIVLDNEFVMYAPATPFDLADALASLIERPAAERHRAAVAASRSVSGASWDSAAAEIVRIVQSAVFGTDPVSLHG